MIRISKINAPQILIDNQALWTQTLLDAIKSYGGYEKIPDNVKDSLLTHYRHKEIQKTLAENSHYKCAFCECKPGESGNIEVEHFEPKSLYPEMTFVWDNLLPSCRKCNESKSDSDTRTTPIINPVKENPEAMLTYSFLQIMPTKNSGDEEKAKNTINICNLNCPRLYDARASLMKSLTEYVDELEDKIKWVSEADTPQKSKVRITKLRNSLEVIDNLLSDKSTYSGYCRWLVSQNPIYQQAKSIANSK